jgi:hypothetical protein
MAHECRPLPRARRNAGASVATIRCTDTYLGNGKGAVIAGWRREELYR